MNRSALLSLYRSLTRHRLYAALNIGGLAVGIAVFLVLGLYVRFETSYEKWLPDHDKLYVVEEYWNQPGSPANGYSTGTMGGLIDELREDFPGIVGTRMQVMDANVIRPGSATSEAFGYADPDFLDVVPLPMARGDGRRALRDPSAVLVDETTAGKYYSGVDPIGRTITLAVMGKAANYRIAGVFRDLPKATVQRFSIIARMPSPHPDAMWRHWGSERVMTWLRFDTPADAARLAGQLRGFVDRRGAKDLGDVTKQLSLPVTPVTDLHLQTPGRKLTMTTLGLVGLLTLLIAIVNYVNLATARAGLRAREVAMRKVLGADRGALVRQFLGEAVLTVALAALIGLILAELGLPLVNSAGGLSLVMPYGLVVPALIGLTLIVALIAGLYPAVLLSRFPAAAVLASARSPGGGRAGTRVREALVVFQFALAIAFTVGTTVLVAQTQHVRSTDLGFRRDGLVIVGSTADSALDKAQVASFLQEVRRLPGVRMVTTSDSTPGYSTGNSANVEVPGRSDSGPSLQWITVGPDFFPTFGFRLLAGRLPDAAHRLDDMRNAPKDSDPVNILVNRRAAGLLGFATPMAAVGRTVGNGAPRTIIGVVDDARFFSPRDPVNGTVYYYASGQAQFPRTTLRVEGDPRRMVEQLRAIWRRVAPQVPFSAKTATQDLQDYYKADERAARLFGIGAGLAVLIGCVGLWGLASFNTARRVKEVGIRKTLGASSADIVKLLVGQFLRPVLIANLLAWPLAFVAMRAWLAGFDDRIALSPLYFVGASLLALAIAVLTVLGQSLRASRAAPAWALRHD
ncbi:putative ABC transport system permease protein [Sphingomonas gellani]|uniref:Putative ABC transport system permease protein n=1 Tax=Sphingomonas gellani TaxID=1166340 RepID=A0A1H8GPL2_9SPHN|nr:ABC transporter permease [Sphingomonas gellani]SEN45735.1 putative ABC transport system permease protein [Sphingomonas gellani]